MRTVWKYDLTSRRKTLEMPKGARPLHVDVQGPAACLWAEVDTDAPLVARRLAIVGTGHPTPDSEEADYAGTFLTPGGGTFVWHIYIAKE